MTKINLHLGIEMPKERQPQQSLAEKVAQYMDICDSYEDSEYHYTYLKSIYEKLLGCAERLNEDQKDMLIVLDDWFRQSKNVASDDEAVDLEGADFFKFRDGR